MGAIGPRAALVQDSLDSPGYAVGFALGVCTYAHAQHLEIE